MSVADGSVECIIGRLQESIDNLKEDIKEIKKTNDELAAFVAEQKAGRKMVWAVFAALAGLAVFAKDIADFVIKVITILKA